MTQCARFMCACACAAAAAARWRRSLHTNSNPFKIRYHSLNLYNFNDFRFVSFRESIFNHNDNDMQQRSTEVESHLSMKNQKWKQIKSV